MSELEQLRQEAEQLKNQIRVRHTLSIYFSSMFTFSHNFTNLSLHGVPDIVLNILAPL